MCLVVPPSASLRATLDTPTGRRPGVPPRTHVHQSPLSSWRHTCHTSTPRGGVRGPGARTLRESSLGAPGHGESWGLLWVRWTAHCFRWASPRRSQAREELGWRGRHAQQRALHVRRLGGVHPPATDDALQPRCAHADCLAEGLHRSRTGGPPPRHSLGRGDPCPRQGGPDTGCESRLHLRGLVLPGQPRRRCLLARRGPVKPGSPCGWGVRAADREAPEERSPYAGGALHGLRLPLTHRGGVRESRALSGLPGGVVPVPVPLLQPEGEGINGIVQLAAPGRRHGEQQRHQQDTRPAGPLHCPRSVGHAAHAPRPVLLDDQQIRPCVTATVGKRNSSASGATGPRTC
ncbi:hypothetical protein ATI61_104312 [Archangium gephyra]|uniref:Basic proline-rich protein n=1 Tax=Archangium gephyra TaxID=48 RepID=A0ABX9K4F7_9BACT|nr:hypothetical protein ATI61_104312 [Archangium gephyra]